MKFLFDFMDKNIAPLFEKGGKFERLYPLFEAGDTFTRTPGDVTTGAPHVRDSIDQKRLMIFVIYALLPLYPIRNLECRKPVQHLQPCRRRHFFDRPNTRFDDGATDHYGLLYGGWYLGSPLRAGSQARD